MAPTHTALVQEGEGATRGESSTALGQQTEPSLAPNAGDRAGARQGRARKGSGQGIAFPRQGSCRRARCPRWRRMEQRPPPRFGKACRARQVTGAGSRHGGCSDFGARLPLLPLPRCRSRCASHARCAVNCSLLRGRVGNRLKVGVFREDGANEELKILQQWGATGTAFGCRRVGTGVGMDPGAG